jgi:hypothetical protein
MDGPRKPVILRGWPEMKRDFSIGCAFIVHSRECGNPGAKALAIPLEAALTITH